MHLYAHLDKLGERALYCDSDSAICVGDMTSELKEKEYISIFVSMGSKNYAYKLCNSVTREVKTVCKVRSITFNYKASQIMNFDTIKDLVLNGRYNIIVTVRTDRKMNRKGGDSACVSIVTEPEDKTYKISFFKRRRRDDNTPVPFWYK